MIHASIFDIPAEPNHSWWLKVRIFKTFHNDYWEYYLPAFRNLQSGDKVYETLNLGQEERPTHLRRPTVQPEDTHILWLIYFSKACERTEVFNLVKAAHPLANMTPHPHQPFSLLYVLYLLFNFISWLLNGALVTLTPSSILSISEQIRWIRHHGWLSRSNYFLS